MIKTFDVLLTGIDGFSGHHIQKSFEKSKIKFIGVSRKYKKKKIIKWDLTKKYNKKINFKIDYIVHTAAIHKIEDFTSNKSKNKIKKKLMIKNLIKFAEKNNIKKFIFFSTIDITNNNIAGIKKSDNLSKLKSEEFLHQAYKKKIFEKVIILRIPAIIGKNANENFLTNVIKNLKNNEDITIMDRKKYNNFVHIKDLCRLILKILSVCSTHKYDNLRFINILNCLSANYINISKKILRIKKILKSNSRI